MNKSTASILASAALTASSLFAQDHLLITEFVAAPAAGQFIEIYNPTADTIDLSHYYLSDATFASAGFFYYETVAGYGGGGGFGDFNARFPNGANIAPGEHQTIAIMGSANFLTAFGVIPNYELYEDGATPNAIPDMLEATPGSINRQGKLSDDSEVIILYRWDGMSDLVQDVDYLVWGNKLAAVDKTGVSMDGADADSDVSSYANDTPISVQAAVNADNDADPQPHDLDFSAQRRLNVEDVESWSGGNGFTGHDETSEDFSWKGGIWSINAPPTPGARALGDSLNIADLQFVRSENIGAAANEDSPFVGDTVAVTGVVMHSMRDIFLGARWSGFIQDERGGPWSGFFILQDDSTVSGTNLIAARPGDKIRVIGVLQEMPEQANTQSITETVLFTNPIQPVETLDSALPLPEPILLKPGDLGATGISEDPRLTERWESTLVRFENLTVINNSPAQPGNIMTAGDGTGTIAIDDFFLNIRTFLDANNGVWPGLPPATKINVTGFVRDVFTNGAGRTTINPRSFDDIELATSPPEISQITRNPLAPKSTETVAISAVITDAQSIAARTLAEKCIQLNKTSFDSAQDEAKLLHGERSRTMNWHNSELFSQSSSAELHYRVNGGTFRNVTMSAVDSLFTGGIPAQTDGALVEYFIAARDDRGDASTAPTDTSSSRFFYFVRDAGLTIFDLQFTSFANGRSGFEDLEVTVSGVVTTESSDFPFYWIQNGREPWNGILINDPVNKPGLGDEVTLTGIVREVEDVTQITDVNGVAVNRRNQPVPVPVVLPTGDLTNAAMAERWEGMLVKVENVTVSDPFPEAASHFGEFVVDDGSGPARVDVLGRFSGNADSSFALGTQLLSVTGLLHFSSSMYKIEPRNESDVVRKPTLVDSEPTPFTTELFANYPNPFNAGTTIRYQLAKPAQVTIKMFNLLGQQVATLRDEYQPAGRYTIQWNGTNDSGAPVASGVYFYQMKTGGFVRVRKMALLR